jgi:predicted TIM-barrel fold metal-dependent hydrolase
VEIIDAHHHLWDLGKLHYPWLLNRDQQGIFGSYDRIRHSYLIGDYQNESKKHKVLKSVHVEADHDPADPMAETRWLQSVADASGSNGMPHAIVAHADFTRADVEDILANHCELRNVRGIRQILNYHENPRFSYTRRNMLEDAVWRRNFSRLSQFGLSFDLQIYYQQMPAAADLAGGNQDIQLILNHAGMPVERDRRGIEGWRKGMALLAECPNVAVKISGLGMCDPQWSTETLRPFVLESIELFGVDRCMFASNFPVDSLFSDFDTLFDAYTNIVSDYPREDQHKLFRANAERIYRL